MICDPELEFALAAIGIPERRWHDFNWLDRNIRFSQSKPGFQRAFTEFQRVAREQEQEIRFANA